MTKGLPEFGILYASGAIRAMIRELSSEVTVRPRAQVDHLDIMSTFAWLDFTEAERDRAQELVALFRELNTRVPALREELRIDLSPLGIYSASSA